LNTAKEKNVERLTNTQLDTKTNELRTQKISGVHL